MTSGTRPTAMVCEDDPVSRLVAHGALERAGFNVVAQVDTAMDAAHQAELLQPDVMILDLMLPWVRGEFVISVVKQVAPHCAIVVCSSHDAASALRSGAAFAVPKGSVAQLENLLETLALEEARTRG